MMSIFQNHFPDRLLGGNICRTKISESTALICPRRKRTSYIIKDIMENPHRAILVITGWDPYIESYNAEAGTTKPRSYSFDIDNAALEFRFPICASPSP